MGNHALTQLRVKIRSLADEARVIRDEERRAKDAHDYTLVNSLCNHRKQSVRPEARCALLAYAFLRRMPYERLERDPRSKPNWTRIKKMVERFTNATSELDLLDVKTRLEIWIDGGS